MSSSKASALPFTVAVMVAPFVITSAVAFHCWNVAAPRRRLFQEQLCSSLTATLQNETQGRVNICVRSIMDDILSRYDRHETEDWSKTRNYVYHTSDRLTTKQVEQVLHFLDSVFPDDHDLVRSIVQSSPRILRRSVQSNLQPTVKFLRELYGPTLFREAISRNPDLLVVSGLGYDCRDDAVETFLANHLHLSNSALNKLKASHPFVFQLPKDKVQSVISFLESKLNDAGYKNEVIQRILGKVVTSHPHLLNLSVPANLQPRIEFLVEACDLAKKDVATLVKSSPGILGLSVEDNLRPTLEFLSSLLARTIPAHVNDNQTKKAELRKCVLSHPQIMALSLKNLQAKVSYFEAIDALNRNDLPHGPLSARIATKAPVVYSLSLKENIIPTVEFLSRVWGTSAPVIGWDESSNLVLPESYEKISSMIATETLSGLLNEYPSILTLSLEGNIQPTLNFFNRTGYIALNDEWRLDQSRPAKEGVSQVQIIRGRYIAASLFNRLLPRWHFCISKQVGSTTFDANSVAMLPPLHILVGATDLKFCEHIGSDLQQYTEFKSSSVPRLKFSSQFDTWLKTGRPIE